MQKFLQDIIKEAGFLAKGYYLEGVAHAYKSSPSDIVTVADKETEIFLVNKIKEKFPDHGIITEERAGEINPGAEYTWVIDPIDGTRNFANKISHWCVMIGITKNGQPFLGAIYDAMNDELYFAEAGKGAFLNDKKITVNENDDVQNSFMDFSPGHMNTGSPYDSEKYPDYLRFYNNLMGERGKWIFNYGSMLGACYVAAGRMDAVLKNGPMYHDFLAAFVIATEAGARATDCEGNIWQRGRKDMVIANPKLHPKLMDLFNK
ncbi:MAG: inositol monophosphatase [Candidatus Magasanikbacteria bacterium]|nr:inositol monophosphatase [Candidatus Magasanikbacteria bacterium]